MPDGIQFSLIFYGMVAGSLIHLFFMASWDNPRRFYHGTMLVLLAAGITLQLFHL